MSRVANRYSKALFQSALEEKKIDIIQSDIESIKILIIESSDFSNLIQNPLIQLRVKSKLMENVLKGKVDLLTFKFMQLLCQKKRANLLPEIIERFEDLVLDFKGIVRGELVSTIKLGSEQIQRITNKISEITGKSIQLQERIDETLVGGFVVKFKDTVIDLSINGQLEKLREKLVFG